jgi:SAM-dependent methyltransferase
MTIREETAMSVPATDTRPFDPASAEAFAGRIADVLDAGALSVMISIGHRAGLFDALARLPPSTGAEIAARAGLAERYVREWLAAMVTGRIVRYDPVDGTYCLPAEHAACLTRQAPLDNLAVFGQHVAIMGAVQERVLECFRTGAGTAYQDYPCFHEVMAQDSDQTVRAALFDRVLPLAEGISGRLAAGIDVLDAGCGRGSALIAMAARFPASRFVGYDLCADAIAHGRATARSAGLANVRLETRDLTGYDEKGRFDLITSFDAVHDQRDPQGLVRGLHAALRPGGVYLMQDIGGSARLENNLDFPMATLLYAISCTHCTPVSVGQGGAGLGTMWGWETAEAMLREAGFREVTRHVLPHDPMNVWFVARA